MLRTYIYGRGIDEVLVMTDVATSEDYYYLHDHLHSPVAVVDIDGDVIERYEYDAYGKPTLWEGDYDNLLEGPSWYNNPYYFTGRRLDVIENGTWMIQYHRNRFYDYATGRWLNQDPIGYQDGPNLYAYVHSNPVNKIDPQGLCDDCAEDPNPEDFEENPFSELICKSNCYLRYYPYSYWELEECLKRCSPDYPDWNNLIPQNKYNCAGLAFRTYENMSKREVKDYLIQNGGRALDDCSEECKPYEEKCWLWEYDIVMYDPSGALYDVSPGDFHIVCGETGRDGSDPDDCYSKNGTRGLVMGSPDGAPCESWKPAGLEDISGYHKIRFKMTTTCYCGDLVNCAY